MKPSGMDRERAEGEATTWLVRLSEAETDAALRASFEAWRAATPLNAESWARARAAYELIGRREPTHAEHWQSYAGRRRGRRLLPSARRPPEAARSPGRTRQPRLLTPWRIAGLASAACAALLLALLLPGIILRLEADIVTSTAELRSVTLQDGSRVGLAPESAIALGFAGNERRVRLIRGNAFFDVSPDAAQPFHVEAGDAVVTVLGTAFEVRHTDDGTFVAVQEGRVRVEGRRAGSTTSNTLAANEWIDVPRHGIASQGTLKQDDIAPWRKGKLIALNRPAGAVVDDIRRYYPGAIVVQSRAFSERQVSGIYDLGHPARTLRDLASSHGAAVREIPGWLLVITGE